jgi:hypothetical protein
LRPPKGWTSPPAMKNHWGWVCAAVAVAVAVVGCKKDADVEKFIKANDEMAAAIDAAKSADEANKAWANGKEGLKAKFEVFKEARGFQVSEDVTKKLEASLSDAATKICMKQIKGDEYKKVCDEYGDLFKE